MDEIGQHHAAGRGLVRDLEIVELAGQIKVADIIVHGHARIGIADLDADVGGDQVIADGGGADVLDDDLGDRRGRLPVRLRQAGDENEQRAEAKGEFHQVQWDASSSLILAALSNRV